jgi:general secretion pathway protein D
MKTITKIKTFLMFLILVSSLKAEYLEMNLVTFATYTSEANNINILIDEELKKENIVFIINGPDNYLLSAFRKAVTLRGLELVKTEEFYYVRKKEIYLEEPKYRAIKLNFVRYEDISNFLNVYEQNIKFEFIKTSKTLLVKSKEDEFKSIYNMIQSIDTLPKQLKLKITILDTNLDKLRELGSDTSFLNLSNNSNFFFNLISYPFQVKNTLDVQDSKGFYSFLKLLDKKEISEFVSTPTLTLSDEKQTIFNVVDNVPFKSGTVTVDDIDTKTTESYEYKDVGTQITITPHIYKNNNCYIDLELNVSNVVSDSGNLIRTSKKYVKQNFYLPTNKLFVLTGLNKKEIIETHSEIPLLADIPFLGWLFKYDTKNQNKSNLSVVFELVEEENYINDDIKIVVNQNKLKG